MSTSRPRYSKEEFARRGDAIYEKDLGARLEREHQGEFVAIDIESGEYEVDRDELRASDQLVARLPGAQIWVRRIGSRFVRRFGPRPKSRNS
ncbi:MAG: hypothetical protein ACQESR_13425 [Planctomycetota bacterium]